MTPDEKEDRKPGAAGGKAAAKILRARALATFLAKGNVCEACGLAIVVRPGQKVHEARVKRFCNHSCAARFNNSKSHKRTPKVRTCKYCDAAVEGRSRVCYSCKTAGGLANRTKQEVSRATIAKHARYITRASDKCEMCGWPHFVEICHVKPVHSFPGTAKLSEINHRGNLRCLCPNCHWLLDHPRETLRGA